MKLFYEFIQNKKGQAALEAALWGTFLCMIAVFGKEIFWKYSRESEKIQQVTKKELLRSKR